jgi:toxin FitB
VTYLLDTNVVSESRKKIPDANVQHWLESHPVSVQHISVISLGELLQGAKRAKTPEQRASLENWLERLETRFGERVLPLDSAVMQIWADVTATAINRGQTAPLMDSLIAATAIRYGLILVTRNTQDVKALGVKVLNPWKLKS